MNKQNRTDRIIIILALLLLLTASGLFYFDGWMWGGRRNRTDRIGIIVAREGDVRTKFEGDLKWQRAAGGEDLTYDDSIYAGPGSSAKIKVGESEMTIAENSLIVLRRDKGSSFMNINYGSLFGKVAKQDKVIIDTGDGKPIELNSSSQAQIVVKKNMKGKTTINVVSGDADVILDGKKIPINKNSELVMDEKSAPHVEALRLQMVNPIHGQSFYSEEPGHIGFEWKWSNGRKVQRDEIFDLEFANDPVFSKLRLNRKVTGQLTTELGASQSVSLYFRVRGPHGEISPTEQLSFTRMAKPEIVKPAANSILPPPTDVNSLVEFEFHKAESASVHYELAKSADFSTVLATENTRESKRVAELPSGHYFLRAKADYGGNHVTGWTDTVPFQIERKLEQLKPLEMPALTKVLIPNQPYPDDMYAADPAKVKEFLSGHGFLKRFFPGSFDELYIAFNGVKPETLSQSSPAWPKAKMRPGHFTYRYMTSKEGFKPTRWSTDKKLEIAMEPPKPVGDITYGPIDKEGKSEGQWQFTPLLFAKSYDVEVSRDPSFQRAKELKVDAPEVKTPLIGENYWRARARDSQGHIISEFSQPYKLHAAVPQFLAKNEPPVRAPAATESTTTAQMNEIKEESFVKNGWWGWVGGGENYVDYRQSQPGISSLEDHHIKGPSEYVETGYISSIGWGGDFSYKHTPGTIQPANATVDNSSYDWTTMGLEAIYRTAAPFTLFHDPVIYGMRLGFQQHKIPFVFLDEVGNLELKGNEMTDASAGVLVEWTRRRWTYYWLMRYQYPLLSKADGATEFDIHPVFAFDGSIGTSYNLTRQFKLGLFWYGQWHQFGYSYSDGQITNSGFQSLFYSNVDLRLGVDF